jgi:hypothetical protein
MRGSRTDDRAPIPFQSDPLAHRLPTADRIFGDHELPPFSSGAVSGVIDNKVYAQRL